MKNTLSVGRDALWLNAHCLSCSWNPHHIDQLTSIVAPIQGNLTLSFDLCEHLYTHGSHKNKQAKKNLFLKVQFVCGECCLSMKQSSWPHV